MSATENCAVAVLDSDVWWDAECGWNGPTCLCQTQPSFHLILRGLCDRSAVDKAYQPMNDYTDFAKLQLVGHQKSKIDYDEASKSWKLSSAESDVSGISNASHQTFLLGRQSWSIIGDSGCKTTGEEYTVHLKLSGCNGTRQFTCDDGQCVTMEQRCNQHPDCKDLSDEKNCKVLVLSEGYNKKAPPVPVCNEGNGKVNVSVSIDILKLVDID